MVVIEAASIVSEDEEATTTIQNDVKSNGLTEETNEGFETASEGEEEGEGENNGEEESVPSKEDSCADSLTDEQLKQRTLTRANDAKVEGNKLFGAGQYEDALSQYELALQVAPDMPSSIELRSICHANRAACYSKLGRYEETIKECTKALELNPSYMKALIRRGEAHEKLEHFEEAVAADMKKIMELDPSNDQARRAVRRLEPLAAEKREKMKEEMIGKLKSCYPPDFSCFTSKILYY
ncbi:Tetratricopeptide repeat-containing domain [Macleaya cordata]|uniref:Tetratricopeptide repeat-containing domain n=1 Tax=Macleaya cordata TaxID=56857 RepID=A0A200QRQ6_MACCD|nr:Tetratricopeptide repeat-containing domain [Macleaya cordata]